VDELSISGPTQVVHLREGRFRRLLVEPEDAGLKRYPSDAIRGGTPQENARRIEAVLAGREHGAARDVIVLNAAAALVVGGRAEDLREGVARAAAAIDSGAALERLEALRRLAGAPEAVA
ncbi:MAG TPA: hypothetical protein VIL08_06090, partial [Limnochorda sp.]